jgi:hypothetical protein
MMDGGLIAQVGHIGKILFGHFSDFLALHPTIVR